MLSSFEQAGFTNQPNSYSDLDCYRMDSIYLIAIKKYKTDKKLSRQAANHLDEPLFKELFDCLQRVEEDKTIDTVVIGSGHRVAFSRGARIELLLDAGGEFGRRFIDGSRELLYRLHNYPKPLVALINGLTLGGGLELVMACDYRLSGDRENIFFGQPEGVLGLIPGMGGTYNLPRLVGPENALELLITGRVDVTAEEACAMGLVDKVFDSDRLVEEAVNYIKHEVLSKTFPQSHRVSAVDPSLVTAELAEFLKSYREDEGKSYKTAPLARALVTFVLEKSGELDYASALCYEEEAFCYLLGTEDFREGIEALTEEREPVFRGK